MSDAFSNNFLETFTSDSTSVPDHFASLLHRSRAAIHIVHGDMYHDVGGIERFVKESCRYACDELELSSIIIAPCEVKGILLYTVWLDEQLACSVSVETIVWILRKLSYEKEITFSSCNIHNALFWNLEELLILVNAAKLLGARINAYVHDFNYICEQQNLFYNGIKFCGAPRSTKIGLCQSCRHGTTVNSRRSGIKPILEKCDVIVSPSLTSKDIFLKVYPEFSAQTIVEPHLVIEQTNSIPQSGLQENYDDQKVAIIYMGVPSVGKGINRFSELINRFGEHFRWVTIGVEDYFCDATTVQHITYNHHHQQNLSETLERLRPCVVFLGSIIPETFSYTVHESLRAGVPVVTTLESGNIAQVVKQFDGGRAFDSFDSLMSFFETDGIDELATKWAREHRYLVGMNIEGISRVYLSRHTMKIDRCRC